MFLACAMNADEDLLFCDIAETYGVIGYDGISVLTLARLAYGLRDNSRIKLLLGGQKVGTDTLLIAAAVDRLSFLAWAKTDDAAKGKNRPKSITDALTEHTAPKRDTLAFDTIDEFEAAKAAILARINE